MDGIGFKLYEYAYEILFKTLFCPFHSLQFLHFQLNYIDLAPNFSGTLMATGNTLMNISSVLLPVFVSRIVTDVVSDNNIYIVHLRINI